MIKKIIYLCSLLLLSSIVSKGAIAAVFYPYETKVDSIVSLRHKISTKYIPYVDQSIVPALALPLQAGMMMPLFRYSLDIPAYNVRDHYLGKFHTKIGDYTQFAPLALSLGMQALGIEGRSKTIQEAVLSQGSTIAIAMYITLFGKNLIERQRLDLSNRQSFPSGHSAFAFAGAAILDAEYGERFPWLSATGYGLAAFTQLQRIIQRRHWDTDVMVGSAIGISSTYLGYMISDYILRGKRHFRYWDNWEYEDITRSPYNFNFEGDRIQGFNSSLFEDTKNGITYGVNLRIPIYKRWGVNLRANILHSESHSHAMMYDAYSFMTGLSYMQPLYEGRIWLEATADLGYLSEGKLSSKDPEVPYRQITSPYTCQAPIARLGLKAMALSTHHHSIFVQLGYWSAPTARRYDRANKVGLNLFSYGLGFSFHIPN